MSFNRAETNVGTRASSLPNDQKGEFSGGFFLLLVYWSCNSGEFHFIAHWWLLFYNAEYFKVYGK